jgi:hypothetical protein
MQRGWGMEMISGGYEYYAINGQTWLRQSGSEKKFSNSKFDISYNPCERLIFPLAYMAGVLQCRICVESSFG